MSEVGNVNGTKITSNYFSNKELSPHAARAKKNIDFYPYINSDSNKVASFTNPSHLESLRS